MGLDRQKRGFDPQGFVINSAADVSCGNGKETRKGREERRQGKEGRKEDEERKGGKKTRKGSEERKQEKEGKGKETKAPDRHHDTSPPAGPA